MMLFGDTRSYLSFPTFFSTIRKTTFLLFRVYSTVSLLATSSSPPLKNRFLLVLVSLYHTRASNMRGKHIHTYVYFICLLCSIYSLPPPFPLQTSRKPTSQNPHSQSQSQVHCLSPLRWRCPYRQAVYHLLQISGPTGSSSRDSQFGLGQLRSGTQFPIPTQCCCTVTFEDLSDKCSVLVGASVSKFVRLIASAARVSSSVFHNEYVSIGVFMSDYT